MEIYTQYYSTLVLNGKKVLADCQKWGLSTLSGSRLQQFEQDALETARFLLSSGKVTVEKIYSSAAVDSYNNKIMIGERYTFQDTYFAHEKYLYWQNEFANDSNVIVYRPWVKES